MEIGSEFPLFKKDPVFSSYFNFESGEDFTLCLSGRTALDFIIKDIKKSKKISSVALPSYCCHTMIEPFLSNNIALQFYEVEIADNGFRCNFDSLKPETYDAILLIDYFGYAPSSKLDFEFTDKLLNKTIIYDATHSFFTRSKEKVQIDYIFVSFRKWAFFPGIALVIKCNEKLAKQKPIRINEKYVSKRNEASNFKADFLMYGKGEKEVFLSLFKESEKILETDYQEYGADQESKIRLEIFNVPYVKSRRQKNATVLLDGLKNNPIVVSIYNEVTTEDCPLCFPVRVLYGQRDNLRKHLIANEIYCPVHWPKSNHHRISKKAESIYDEELSLVCDQRYDYLDMNRIVNSVNEFCVKGY